MRDWDLWSKRFMRDFPEAFAIRALEFQLQRGAPHWEIAVGCLPYKAHTGNQDCDCPMCLITRDWKEVSGGGSIHMQRRSWPKLRRYLSKKEQKTEGVISGVKKWWGYLNKAAYDRCITKVEIPLTENEFQLMRWKMLREVRKDTPPEQHRDLPPNAGMWFLSSNKNPERWLEELRSQNQNTADMKDVTPAEPHERKEKQLMGESTWFDQVLCDENLDAIRFFAVEELYLLAKQGLVGKLGMSEALATDTAQYVAEIYLARPKPPSLDNCRIKLQEALVVASLMAPDERRKVVLNLFMLGLECLPPDERRYGTHP